MSKQQRNSSRFAFSACFVIPSSRWRVLSYSPTAVETQSAGAVYALSTLVDRCWDGSTQHVGLTALCIIELRTVAQSWPSGCSAVLLFYSIYSVD